MSLGHSLFILCVLVPSCVYKWSDGAGSGARGLPLCLCCVHCRKDQTEVASGPGSTKRKGYEWLGNSFMHHQAVWQLFPSVIFQWGWSDSPLFLDLLCVFSCACCLTVAVSVEGSQVSRPNRPCGPPHQRETSWSTSRPSRWRPLRMPWPVTSCENDTEQWILSAFLCLFNLSHCLDLVSHYSVFI